MKCAQAQALLTTPPIKRRQPCLLRRLSSGDSLAYYAAYQAATALLLYHGLTPPEGREAWSHETTPELVRQLPSKLLKPELGKDFALRLAAAYELRLAADYVGNAEVDAAKLRTSLKNTRFISSVVQDILPQKKA